MLPSNADRLEHLRRDLAFTEARSPSRRMLEGGKIHCDPTGALLEFSSLHNQHLWVKGLKNRAVNESHIAPPGD